jgi:signal transduction histidine kinase
MLIANCAALGGVLVLAAACIWGLYRQRAHVEASLQEDAAIKMVESAQLSVVAAKAGLDAHQPDVAKVIDDLHNARMALRGYKSQIKNYSAALPAEVGASTLDAIQNKTQTALNSVNALLVSLGDSPQGGGVPAGSKGAGAAVGGANPASIAVAAVEDLGSLLATCNQMVDRTQAASASDLHLATNIAVVLALVIPLWMVLATLWQYRRIMVPLQSLRQWARRVSGGDLTLAYRASSDREFAELGQDINRMATELQAFYRRLEEMVAAKSKDLARSERLASVGFLAAGVAHEINNPLNIMSGHAELSTRRLQQVAGNGDAEEVFKSLRIIREEAFRCKQITQKLLLLARGGGARREPVSLRPLIVDVVHMVQGLESAQGHQVNIRAEHADLLCVRANAAELKQVLLNLLINALEAVGSEADRVASGTGGGRVEIEARTVGKWVQMIVSDNGRGMSAATLEHIFEPFYSEKRGSSEPGTGLGLSITHAIVADMGGTLAAQSEGPGRGSRFTVQLVAEEVVADSPSLAQRVEQLLDH